MGKIALLSPDKLIKTGHVDHADWNFRGLLGGIQRLRFALVRSLLKSVAPIRLLEIGYGSGIFMPELANHCKELYGIDVHARNEDVARTLAGLGVEAILSKASAEYLDFPSGYFDCIIAVSSLEFVPNINLASAEMRRVMKPDGRLILVTPGHSPLVDFGLKMLTGESAEKDYGQRRQALLPALSENFREEKRLTFPPLTGSHCLYKALSLKPKAVSLKAAPDAARFPHEARIS